MTACATGSEPLERIGLVNLTDNVRFLAGEAEGMVLRYYENGTGTLCFVLETYGLTVPHRPPGADKQIYVCLSHDNVLLERKNIESSCENAPLPYIDEAGNKWLFNLSGQQALFIKMPIEGRNIAYIIQPGKNSKCSRGDAR